MLTIKTLSRKAFVWTDSFQLSRRQKQWRAQPARNHWTCRTPWSKTTQPADITRNKIKKLILDFLKVKIQRLFA